MAITRIPKPYRSGFATIKKLSPADMKSLIAALERMPTFGERKEKIAGISKQLPSLKREDVEDIVRTLFSLCMIRSDADTPLPEFVSELTRAMQATGMESLALSEEERNEFQDNITKLLNLDNVTIASKVELLRIDYPKTFHDAKIYTDIRPIFAKPEERPVGAAITRMLKIEYHELGEHKEFFVALDEEDLQKMKKAFQRAETKTSSLRSLLKVANLPDLS